MPSLAVLTSLVLLAASDLAVAQIMGPNCTLSLAQSFNSLGQSPCIVAAYMLATCNGSVFIIQPLRPGNSYTVDKNSDFNDCLCTTVIYNLLSVCDACQGQNWTASSNYSSDCTAGPFPVWFPYTVPLGTSVPHWALTDHTFDDNWNATEAGMGDDDVYDEIEPGYSVNDPTSPSSTPSSEDTSEDTPSSESGPNTAAIAGGVSGGVVALAAVGVLLFYFLRKRRRSQAPSAAVDGGTPPMSQEHPPQSGDETYVPKKPVAPMKLYDPNDPRTFPKYERVSASAEDVHDPVAPNGNTLTKVQAAPTLGYHGLPIV